MMTEDEFTLLYGSFLDPPTIEASTLYAANNAVTGIVTDVYGCDTFDPDDLAT